MIAAPFQARGGRIAVEIDQPAAVRLRLVLQAPPFGGDHRRLEQAARRTTGQGREIQPHDFVRGAALDGYQPGLRNMHTQAVEQFGGFRTAFVCGVEETHRERGWPALGPTNGGQQVFGDAGQPGVGRPQRGLAPPSGKRFP